MPSQYCTLVFTRPVEYVLGPSFSKLVVWVGCTVELLSHCKETEKEQVLYPPWLPSLVWFVSEIKGNFV